MASKALELLQRFRGIKDESKPRRIDEIDALFKDEYAIGESVVIIVLEAGRRRAYVACERLSGADRSFPGPCRCSGSTKFLLGQKLEDFSRDELKAHLAARKLPIEGSKAELIDRLKVTKHPARIYMPESALLLTDRRRNVPMRLASPAGIAGARRGA